MPFSPPFNQGLLTATFDTTFDDRAQSLYFSNLSPPRAKVLSFKTDLPSSRFKRSSASSRLKARRSPSSFASRQPRRQSSTMSESEADKRRNKLGYQRISIACAHCRRRKIRCVMAEGDSHSRCQNCIRLKKDCVFYPVDQQNALERTSSSTSKTDATSGPSSAMSTSPSELAGGRPFDQRSQFHDMTSVPPNMPQDPHSLPLQPGSALHGRGHLTPLEYRYRPQETNSRQWSGPGDLSPESQHAMAGPVGGAHGTFWPAGPGAYLAPFAAGDPAQSLTPDTRSYSFPGREGEQAWQPFPPQARSVSYGNLHSMPPGYMHQPSSTYGPGAPPHHQMGPPHFGGPPHLDVEGAAALQPMPGPHSAPGGGGGGLLHPPYGHAQQYAYPVLGSSGPAPPQAGGWYQNPAAPYEQYEHDTEEAEKSVPATRPHH